MRRRLLLSAFAILWAVLALSTATRAQSAAAGVVGAWSAQEDYFRASILIEPDAAGTLQAFFTGDDLRPGAPLSAVEVRGDSVFFGSAVSDVRFGGVFSEEGPTIRGTYRQGDASVPLTLVPATPRRPEPVSRPQDPVPPFPYVSTDVAFPSGPSVRLAGTLTVPGGPGPHPAVVLIPGTGDNGRDFEVHGHRPFLVLADHLARLGVAVLRYDERGAGESGGDSNAAQFNSEPRDVAAAMRYLRGRPEIDAGRIGLIGHSMGGVSVPFVHENLEPAQFLVLLMAPSAPLGAMLGEQSARMAAVNGASAEVVEAERVLGRAVLDAAMADTDSLTAAAAMAAAYDAAGVPADYRDLAVRANTSPVYREMARYDPRPVLERVDVPVLAVYGRTDTAVTPAENAAAMTAALAASPSRDATVVVLGEINHYLQPSVTGREDEAAASTVTVAPELLDLIGTWVASHAGTSARLEGD